MPFLSHCLFKALGHQQAIQPPRRGGAGVQGTALSFAPRVTWRAASPLSGGSGASAAALGARARRPARSAARSLVEPAGADRGWRMALRGPAAFGPGSRGSLDEAGAEGREAAALSAAGVTPEDEEEDDGRRGLLRWDGFSAWLHCVCVVGFDLELGQAVENTLITEGFEAPRKGCNRQDVCLGLSRKNNTPDIW
ncbi:uncharacterized protein [Alexandromys fortis]|uniref:uncharacterized protein isoform X2 n=1 Tax=Alexandromys fortis TaxID=100897 RepID=UPI0021536E44|nr:uncharacterized protein LOC126492825 isoform X2 [Microtus fortis]